MSQLMSGLNLTPLEAQKRRDRLALGLKVGAVAVVGVVVAPLVFTLLAVTTAAVVTGALALTTIAVAPVLSLKLANWKLKAIMDEASKNPIPTLENDLIARKTGLEQAAIHLTQSLAQVEGFVTQAQDAARKYPDQAERYLSRSKKAGLLADEKKRAFMRAEKTVIDFEAEVERARIEWKLVLAESAMNKSLNVIAGDPMAQLRARTALNAVTDRMNEAFASMEVTLLRNGGDEALEPAPTSSGRVEMLEMQAGNILAPVSVVEARKVPR